MVDYEERPAKLVVVVGVGSIFFGAWLGEGIGFGCYNKSLINMGVYDLWDMKSGMFDVLG